MNLLHKTITRAAKCGKLYTLYRKTSAGTKEKCYVFVQWSDSQFILYTLLRNAHYILFSDKHTIFSSQKCTLYRLPRYPLTEIHKSSSQINTINPSPQTICPFRRYTQCIIFSDRHTISSLRYRNYIFFTEIHMCSFQKSTLFFLYINVHCIFFSGLHTTTSFRKNTYYSPYHYKRL